MVDIYSKKKRSQIMGCVRESGNVTTELKFLSFLKQYGLTGWRRKQHVYGKPDFVFPRERIAVFVDGCFWHGCPQHGTLPATNTDFWNEKIHKNIKRDRKVARVLRNSGWCVMRIWEHDLTAKKVRNRILMLKRFMEDRR